MDVCKTPKYDSGLTVAEGAGHREEGADVLHGHSNIYLVLAGLQLGLPGQELPG